MPDQVGGDLAAKPLFPNRARHGPATPKREEGHERGRHSSRATQPPPRPASNQSPPRKFPPIDQLVGDGFAVSLGLTLADLRQVIHVVARGLSEPATIRRIVDITGLDYYARLPGDPASAMDRWASVFKAALEASPETLAALLDNIRDSLSPQSRDTLETALRQIGLSYVSRITRTAHPELGDQTEALLAAANVPEMIASAESLRQTAFSVRRLLMNPLLTDAYLQLAPSDPDPEHRRMELTDLAVEIVTATDHLLSLLGVTATPTPQLVLEREAGFDRAHGREDDDAFDRLTRRRLDARNIAVRLGMRLLHELGDGFAVSLGLTLADLRQVIHVVARGLSEPATIRRIVDITGLDYYARLPGDPASAMDRWASVFKAALEASPETLAALLDNIRDSLSPQSRDTLETALRQIGLSYVSRITRTAHPELGDQTEALLAAANVPEMIASAESLRQTAFSVRRLLMNPLLTDAYLQLAPSDPDPEHRRMELTDLAVEIVTATDHLLSLLGVTATPTPQLVLEEKLVSTARMAGRTTTPSTG